MPVSLPLTRSAAAASLVGDRDLGHLQLVAVGVDAATGVEDRADAGDADRVVGDAGPPRPAHRVADDDADRDTELLVAARRAAAGPIGPGRRGSSASSLRATFDASTPAAASTSPCRVCTIRSGPRGRPRAPSRRRSPPAGRPRARRGRRNRGGSAGPRSSRSTFDVTTRTSPSSSGRVSATIAAARSSPGRSSPMPVTGRISIRAAGVIVATYTRQSSTRPRAPSPPSPRRRSSTAEPPARRRRGRRRCRSCGSASRRARRRRSARRSGARRPRR